MTQNVRLAPRFQWATLQIVYLLMHFHFPNAGSVRISPASGWYVKEIKPHENFRFHCEDASGPIVWKHNGRQLNKQQSCTSNDDIHVCNSSVYISTFRQEFAGVYTCEDTRANSSSSVVLGVPPKFVEQSKSPVDKIVSTEEELRLSCQIQSHVYPKAVVTWYKYGRFGKLKIQEGELLSKTELDMEADSGTYMCQASNHPNGSTLRKIFFVKVYEPARCAVSPSSIIIMIGETLNVSLVLSGTPQPTYRKLDPWKLELDGRAIKATSSCNTSGNYTILDVVQTVYLRGVSRQARITCSLAVTVQITPEVTTQVCLLMQEIKQNPSCSTRVIAARARTLSNRMQSAIHSQLGCFWNIEIHYVFTAGKTNCTTIEYGVTVIVSSELPCSSVSSFTNIRDAVISWANSETDLSIIKTPVDRNPRIFCRKIKEIQKRLPVSCSTEEFGVHVRCKSSEGIVRLCTTCTSIFGSKCVTVDAALTNVTEFNLLNTFCF